MAGQLIVPNIVWQCDPKWKHNRLGFGTGDFCQYGCVLCCVTSMIQLLPGTTGIIDPPAVDAKLEDANHYWGDTKNLINLLTVFRDLNTSFDSLGIPSLDIKHTDRIQAPKGMQYAKSIVRKNLDAFAILKIRMGIDSWHFVLAYGVNSRNRWLCMDPLFGRLGMLPEYYSGEGRIERMDVYRVPLYN